MAINKKKSSNRRNDPIRMKVALGVSGGIACYKSAEILRRLQDRGVEVVVLMTKGATQFVTPLTFRALSGNKVYVDIFEGARSGADFEGAFDHILVAHSTDLFLVAPATADCIARLAIGLADDFLTTFHLAVTAPVVVAPAMKNNCSKWKDQLLEAALTETTAGELQDHLSECPGCAQRLSLLRARRERLDAALPLLAGKKEPAPGFGRA